MFGGQRLNISWVYEKSNQKFAVDLFFQGIIGQFSNGSNVPIIIEGGAEVIGGAVAEKWGGN